MRSKILPGAALALAAVLATAGPAQSWQGNRGTIAAGAAGLSGADLVRSAPATSPSWAMGYYYEGYYPGYAYAPGYNYAPLYGYHGAYNDGPWSYRGGPHPR